MKLIQVFDGREEGCRTFFQDVSSAAKAAREASNNGADGILAIDRSESDAEHEQFIECCREMVRESECPLYLGGAIRRFEDVKKYLYTGAACVLIRPDAAEEMAVYQEAVKRFGSEKVKLVEYPLMIRPLKEAQKDLEYCFIPYEPGTDCYAAKQQLKANGFSVELFVPAVSWSELKKNSEGLVPCIVQDYRTDEVLMMAYMDEAAYQETASLGRMCYYSRSRKERWLKGETSGHYQYVKSLYADCDKDTLLARVAQVGAACHTGSHSCFFNQVFKKESAKPENPYRVFEDVYGVIMDRKLHPKEGSYTNYLFDKGIDKILKKCGEEATEIVIAAKNPDPEEIKYEISDFLYHMMVLMAEKGVTWEDITRELANR